MAIRNKISFVLILMVVSLWSCSSLEFMNKQHIYIENGLGPSNVLTVHCKSKDIDLGERNVNYQQSYEWSFMEHFFYSTVFWCRIWWYDHHRLVWVHNDMWDSANREQFEGCIDDSTKYKGCKLDGARCCVRRAQWDGIYFIQWKGAFKKIYNWRRE
ncbi:hypothetical protein AQUCO_00300348v1 [Aquilegia coerulea]|uniref:S-protein homolog n=1 Tax=Aquilegia coerulea TaxID=218851 RepID=A0A2G5EYP9_AQUCA|nr:hypothetical protein AQUCO_00300348v1 [Aquilegia coerulea]